MKTLRVCSNGHKYYKSTDCPTCPVCEQKRKPEGTFLSNLSAPARRALEQKGITTLQQLSKYSEAEILDLHGMGPGSIPKLQMALKMNGLSFKKQKSTLPKPKDVKNNRVTKSKAATTKDKLLPSTLTASQFMDKLTAQVTKSKADNMKFFKDADKTNKSLGVRMLNIFELAKQFAEMPLNEIEKLLDSDYYEARMGAVSIMDFQARDKKISTDRKKALYDLYINRHDRINNWDMVDRSAPYVVGGYLFDKPRKILYKLAKSKNVWERRTAIVSTYFFIRQNDIDDTFKIAELLINDERDLINKAVGSWVREAGKRDNQKLLDFLDKHAATMPRTTLRYAIEKLDKKQKDHYMKMK